MNISEYRNRNRKPITLPSGLKGWVRQPSVADLAKYPALLKAGLGGGMNPGTLEGDLLRDFIHCSLRHCFMPEGGVMTEKEPGQCLPSELSVQDLEGADAIAIFGAVREMGGLTGGKAAAGEGGPEGAPFREPGSEGADGAPGDTRPEVRDSSAPAG